ncbi:uncharacterized protein LOC125231693 [Leguminivora glycinivorella]|uniref:uncharacterized protein LOC125231693 n=1 Tax=Leguminivora glycinivorella TaxID=1035111 RepID=UPI00200BA622|nr:uncharacterized protein LOC125231693 [Leguminivora glycinivorella]
MGCTSSAPTMAPANATERNISFADEEEKPAEKLNKMETQTQAIIENKVLPNMCDNLDDSILLSENGKCILDTASQRIDKDVQTDNFRIGNENAWDESFRLMQEEKEQTPKLEEVVEQVVEMLHSENTESARSTPEEPEAVVEVTEVSEEVEAVQTAEDLGKNYEHLEEMVSPSQSESSRATRWEALADIAAELPPSLAVDPLTGQIYTLK